MRLRFHWLPLVVCLAGLLPGLWGCPGTLADPAEFADAGGSEAGSETGDSAACTAAAVAAVPTTVFQQTCGVAGCHNPTDPEEGLDLGSPGVASRLMNIPSLEEPNLDLISSMDPQNSYILLKLSPTPPFGAQMPFGGPYLSAESVACVAAWIDSVIADAGPGAAGEVGGGDGGAADGGADAIDDAASPGLIDSEGGNDSGTDAPADAGMAVARDSGAKVTLTVLNYKSWCSVTINGAAASTNAMLVASVVAGTTATMVATPASTKFSIGTDPWFGVTQNDGGAAAGADQGLGSTETSTATVIVMGEHCVSVCCGDAPNATNCPLTDPCP